MTFEAAIAAINAILWAHRGRYLSDLEKAVFYGSWEGLTYREMEQDARFPWAEQTLKDAGAELWQQLSQALGEDVKKTNFKAALERHQINFL